MISFFRVVKFAFQDIVRNFSLSLMTVFILVLMLLSMNALAVVRLLTGEAVTAVKDQIDVSIYFHQDAKESDIEEIKSFINGFPEVTDTDFIAAEIVLEKFQSMHSENDDIKLAIEEVGENPFGPTLIVKTREPGDYEKIITAISVPEYDHIIESKTFGDSQRAIERIDTVTSQAEYFVYVISSLFIVIAFMVIFNTIKVIIYTQRAEIGIKKLVGASNWFVRGPYFIEAFIFSLLSTAITATIVYSVASLVDPYIEVVFNQQGFLTKLIESNIMAYVGIQFALVLFLTLVTSGLAMRRYLRK